MRAPRKSKKKIPTGNYCYKFISMLKDGSGYNIKPCAFYKRMLTKDIPEKYKDDIDLEYPNERISWCSLVKNEIDDQCKICNLRR